MSLVRAYLATSLDGFVAGVGDDLEWLEGRPDAAPPVAAPPWAEDAATGVAGGEALGFEDFLAGVGCMLMGRRTYDIVASFPDWPYGEVPVLVATHRPLDVARPWVRAVAGDLAALVARACDVAGERDVYVDGAAMVRSALEQRLLDHLVLTLVPTVLGDGVPLFAGSRVPAELTLERVARYGPGLAQLHLRCPAA